MCVPRTLTQRPNFDVSSCFVIVYACFVFFFFVYNPMYGNDLYEFKALTVQSITTYRTDAVCSHRLT